MNDINHLLDTLQEGDPVAADRLLVPVYSELRRLAAAKMSRESAGHPAFAQSALECADLSALWGRRQLAAAGGAVARVPARQTLPARTSPLPPQSADQSAQSKALRAKGRRCLGIPPDVAANGARA